MKPALARLLPQDVLTAEARGDLPDVDLYPVELAHVRRAVPKRRREFATGRACARAALAKLGVDGQAIGVGSGGAPCWPPGIVGSITHCNGFRGCAVAMRTRYLGLGIDAEPNAALPAGLLGDIATKREMAMLETTMGDGGPISWDRLLFCAKESVYKTWHPSSGSPVGFQDLEVSFECAAGLGRRAGRFRARLVHAVWPATPSEELDGAWEERDGLLLVAATLSATPTGTTCWLTDDTTGERWAS